MLPAAGSLTLAQSRYEFFAARLIIAAAFTWHKEKDGKQN